MASATICCIPVYAALASPERNGTPRNMIILVSLFCHGGDQLEAVVDWQTVSSEMLFLTHSVSAVRASTPPYVDAVYPPEILHNPLYLVVHDPPGFVFPNCALITINVTEFTPGDPLSIRVSARMGWMPPARRIEAGRIMIRSRLAPPPVYAFGQPTNPTDAAGDGGDVHQRGDVPNASDNTDGSA